MPWTCPKCKTRWATRNRLRCTCGRKQPKRPVSYKRVSEDLPRQWWTDRYGEVCNICGAPPGQRALHRDHWHGGKHSGDRAGEPRGLLCFRCNAALRPYMDAAWLRAAADYLER